MFTRPDRFSREGYTLLELMIVVVLTGIFSTIIFQLLQGHSRFTEMQSARQETLQNTRGTLALLASELRAVPAGAITLAQANRIAFRLPRAYGVLCAPLTPGMSGTAWIAFPTGSFPPDFTMDNLAAWGLAVRGTTQGTFEPMRVSGEVTAGNPCVADMNIVTGTGVPGAPQLRGFNYTDLAGPVAALRDSSVFAFQPVEYRVDASGVSALQGQWIMRRVGNGQFEPLAGPIVQAGEGSSAASDVGGLRFRYLCGSAEVAPALVSGTSVDAIRVIAAMRSNNGNSTRQTDIDSVTVHLRNSERTCI